MSFANSRCAATTGQIAIIANIRNRRISPYARLKALSAKYFKNDEQTLPVRISSETKDELAAEAKGRNVERG